MIRILIADDYAPVRQGLRMLISVCADLLVRFRQRMVFGIVEGGAESGVLYAKY